MNLVVCAVAHFFPLFPFSFHQLLETFIFSLRTSDELQFLIGSDEQQRN
jgi:hypothetical protein